MRKCRTAWNARAGFMRGGRKSRKRGERYRRCPSTHAYSREMLFTTSPRCTSGGSTSIARTLFDVVSRFNDCSYRDYKLFTICVSFAELCSNSCMLVVSAGEIQEFAEYRGVELGGVPHL